MATYPLPGTAPAPVLLEGVVARIEVIPRIWKFAYDAPLARHRKEARKMNLNFVKHLNVNVNVNVDIKVNAAACLWPVFYVLVSLLC